MFQTDSMICSENKDLLDKFLKYDYVGAPWNHGVGNGGFSLRRKSKMLKIISTCEMNDDNEDLYFSNSCIPLNNPSIEEAKEFSVEMLYSDKSFGVHQPWTNLSTQDFESKMEKCTDLRKLWELNKK